MTDHDPDHDPDHAHDDESAEDAGDAFSRIVLAVQALRSRLAALSAEPAAAAASSDWSTQVASLAEYATELGGQLGQSADLAFEAQDELVQSLAAQATEQLATALREAGDAFQTIPWGETETAQHQVEALEAAWDETCDAGWHLQAVLEDVR
ncbi:hypothetical protein [Pseudaquabacterium rugosum]|uniref:Uncharacterized protein n=1 Tax=Pseudaquabacterium rugosum TaxID=2984194 RepID=A0ABU9BHT5_9BURK